MKRVTAIVEFILDDEDDVLQHMTHQELATEMRELLENERGGMAEWGSAGIRNINVVDV